MNRGNITVYNPSTNIHIHHINLNIVLDIWFFFIIFAVKEVVYVIYYPNARYDRKKPTVLHTLHIFFIFFLVKKCVHTDKNDPTSQEVSTFFSFIFIFTEVIFCICYHVKHCTRYICYRMSY